MLVLFLVLSFGKPLLAQQTLTLSDAINIALKNSFDIQLAKNNLSISTITDDV